VKVASVLKGEVWARSKFLADSQTYARVCSYESFT